MLRIMLGPAIAILLVLGQAQASQPDSEETGQVRDARPTPDRARVISEADLGSEILRHRGQPFILHFWATWCGPCLAELPLLARKAQEMRAKGVGFLAVSLDSPTPKSAQRVSSVLAARIRDPHWSAILRVADVDRFMSSIDPGWEGEIPVFFAFDRDVKLRVSHLGNIGPAELDAMVNGLSGAGRP